MKTFQYCLFALLLMVSTSCGVQHLVGNGQNKQALACGGRGPNAVSCPQGDVCVDNPNTCSQAADCLGICVSGTASCGGIAGLQCPAATVCVDDPRDNCELGKGADCIGLCAPLDTLDPDAGSAVDGGVDRDAGAAPDAGIVECGGFVANPGVCAADQVCVDNPDTCAQALDCPGVCVSGTAVCGGLAGLPCPAGTECVDDPRDNCSPLSGGADCSGLCAPKSPVDGGSALDAGSWRPDSGVGVDGGWAHDGGIRPDGGWAHDGGVGPDGGWAHDGGAWPDGGWVHDGGVWPDGGWAQDAGPAPDAGFRDGGTGQVECGGFVANPGVCAANEICVDNPNTCSQALDCPGVCASTSPGCGGIAGLQCTNGGACVDDPRDSCNPVIHADCSGVCIPP